jgi:hypothetical protein
MPFFAQGWRGAASDLTVPMMQTCAFSNAHPVLSIWPPSIIQWQQITVLYSLQGQSRTLDLKLSRQSAGARLLLFFVVAPVVFGHQVEESLIRA